MKLDAPPFNNSASSAIKPNPKATPTPSPIFKLGGVRAQITPRSAPAKPNTTTNKRTSKIMLVFMDKLEGADFVWLSLISIYIPLNPFTGQPFMLMFSFFLVGMTAATYFGIFMDNLMQKHILSLEMKRGIPFLIPISCALIFALVIQ